MNRLVYHTELWSADSGMVHFLAIPSRRGGGWPHDETRLRTLRIWTGRKWGVYFAFNMRWRLFFGPRFGTCKPLHYWPHFRTRVSRS